MTLVAYPAGLPPPATAPLTPAERRQLSAQDGARIARAAQRDRLGMQSAAFFFTFAEMAVFTAWLRDALVFGSYWFGASWSSPQGGTLQHRFVGEPRRALVPGRGWNVSAIVELRGLGMPQDDRSDRLGRFDPAYTFAGNGTSISGGTLSNGNETITNLCPFNIVSSGITRSINARSDRRYFEARVDTLIGNAQLWIGFCVASFPVASKAGIVSGAFGKSTGATLLSFDGTKVVNDTRTLVPGDVAMVAFDIPNGRAWVGVNGVWSSGNPSTGVAPSLTGQLAQPYYAAIGWDNANAVGGVYQSTATGRFVASEMSYPIPAGFLGISD